MEPNKDVFQYTYSAKQQEDPTGEAVDQRPGKRNPHIFPIADRRVNILLDPHAENADRYPRRSSAAGQQH